MPVNPEPKETLSPMVYKSYYPDVEVPDKDIFVVLFDRKPEFPETQEIFIDDGTERSYRWGEIESSAQAFGAGLRAHKLLQKGEVLCIFSPNTIDYGIVTWGTHFMGGVVTTANSQYTVHELVLQLRSTKAQVVVCWPSILPTALAAAALVKLPKDRVFTLGIHKKKKGDHPHWTSLLISKHNPAHAQFFVRPDINPAVDLAYLVSSSGTTGLPKMIMLSHRNMATNLMQYAETEKENSDWRTARYLVFAPFFHTYGLACSMQHSVWRGTTCVVMEKFEVEWFLGNVKKFKITYCNIVPPTAVLLAKHPSVSNHNLSSLLHLNSGAAPLSPSLIDAVHARLNVPIKQGYGLSETSPVAFNMLFSEALIPENKGGVGRLLPNLEVKYLDDSGKELARGETGEICVRGGSVMVGYLNNEEATREAIDEEGSLHTGGIGFENANGILFVVDRKKELIKYKGHQVAPAELEGVLVGFPDIADAAVAGVYSEELQSELPRAFVVLKPGVEKSAETVQRIHAFVREKLAPFKWLRGGIEFVESIPKSASGKILRREIRERIRKREMGEAKQTKK